MDINIDALYNILKQNQGDVNDALGYKKKAVVVTSDPLALVAEKTKITALLAKTFNRKKYYAKPTNNNLRTSSANKKPEYVKSVEKKEDNKVKDYNYYKTKMLLAKKGSDEQVLLAEDQAWMESSSDSDQEINANMVFMAKMEKVLSDSDESSSSAEETITEVAYYISKSKNCDESEVDHNNSEEKDYLVDKLIRKFNHKIAKYHKRIAKENQQSKNLEKQNKDLQDKYDVLINQVNTFEEENNELNEQINVLNEKNVDFLTQMEVLQDQFKVKHVVIDTHTECQAQYAKLEEERYEYMIRYSALCDNNKQHRKKIDEQEILFDKMSRQLVKMNNNVLRLQENILEKESKIFELEGCVSNKDFEIETCLKRFNDCENKLYKIGQINQMIHMIMYSKDTLYNGKKGIVFENPSYFKKAKDFRHSLYDEKVIGLGYTMMFLTHSDEALEIKKFKRARENKIKFAYDYGNLNASYVNEKINFSDDYFQEIINPDFKKIDSPFQQKSSLKPYVSTVILEKIIIDLEDEVVSLLEKEKANLELIESLKSKGFKSSKNAISESENQSENDCHVVEKDLDTFSSVRRPKHSGVIWKKKWSSNTSNVDLSSVSHSKLNKDVKQYSREDLLSCNNSHFEETSSAYNCNDAMNVFCNSRLCDSFNENNLFIFDDIVQICLWIIDSGCSKHMTGNRALLTNFVEKFLGTVRFGNNDFAVIVGYGDVVIGSMTIKKVYYIWDDMEGLGSELYKLEELEYKVEMFGWSRLTWSKRERCGHFKDQEMDCGACKQILDEGVDLISDEDPTDEDGDTEVSVSLGEISSEGKKS
uniref:Integrase, catalytic region, zinc finger, CCHC-type, peptidase aspartic, catalytic n=1 Tax=Tanacetum cinerariifolium TaxID=118510 RepID=A0A6L2LKT6_TANCI|nr:integrase, catalytic region, zinc finger, CCHC-type, peptidase aspartic, catalytic [Tanacetum cinerariifolium]